MSKMDFESESSCRPPKITIQKPGDQRQRKKSVTFPRNLDSNNENGTLPAIPTTKRRMSVQFKQPKTKTLPEVEAGAAAKKNTNAWRKIVETTLIDDTQKLNEYNTQFASRRKSDMSFSNRAVLGLLFDLQETKKQRARVDVEDELKKIHKRVKAALIEFDPSDMDVDEDEDGLNFNVRSKLPLRFDAKSKRQKKQHQSDMMSHIDTYKEGCDTRTQLLIEVHDWTIDNLYLDIEDPPDLDYLLRHCQKIYSEICDTLKAYTDTSEKVVHLGKKLLHESGFAKREDETDPDGTRGSNEKIRVFDERSVLNDQGKWDSAMKLVMYVLEEAVRFIKVNANKNVVRNGQRQFRILANAIDKRMNELTEKKKAVTEMSKKLEKSQAILASRTKEAEELKKSFTRISSEMQETKQLLDKSEKKKKTLEEKLSGAEDKVKGLEEALKQKEAQPKPRTPSPPPTPPPRLPTPPPLTPVKQVDSEMELKMKQLEDELKESKDYVTFLADQVADLEKLLHIEQDKVQALKEAAERAAIEIDYGEPMYEIPPEPQVEGSDKDANYYRTLLAGMKKDFAAEMDKLKSHLKREKQRNAASIRRIEMNHKEQLQVLMKDIYRVLRAILHFRDHIMAVMEKHNLKEPGSAMKQLGGLVPDQLAPDPREVLGLLVANVVEFLHNMENIMTNAFLAMKFLLKSPSKVEEQPRQKVDNTAAINDITSRLKNVGAAKWQTKQMARRLRKTKDKLKQFEDLTDKHFGDKKYLSLLARYRGVWQMYDKLQKEMGNLKTDFEDTIQQKLTEQKDFVVGQIKMELKEKRAQNEEKLRLSILEQKENLKTLDRAFGENKISKELHSMATALISKVMEIPEKRLRYLIEQYIAFRAVKESQKRTQDLLKDDGLTSEVRNEMEAYMKNISAKLHISMKKWHKMMHSLDEERCTLYNSMWTLFNEVLVESGVLLIHPLMNEASDKMSLYKRAAGNLHREKMRQLFRRNPHRYSNMVHMPILLAGNTMKIVGRDEGDNWSPSPQASQTKSMVNTPHTLNYDINGPCIEAQRHLTSKDRKSYPLSLSRSYDINIHQQIYFISQAA